jgi:hypothetical protein
MPQTPNTKHQTPNPERDGMLVYGAGETVLEEGEKVRAGPSCPETLTPNPKFLNP